MLINPRYSTINFPATLLKCISTTSPYPAPHLQHDFLNVPHVCTGCGRLRGKRRSLDGAECCRNPICCPHWGNDHDWAEFPREEPRFKSKYQWFTRGAVWHAICLYRWMKGTPLTRHCSGNDRRYCECIRASSESSCVDSWVIPKLLKGVTPGR